MPADRAPSVDCAGGADLGGAWGDDDLSGDELTPAEILALEQADGVWDDPAWLEERYAQDFPPEEPEEAGEPGGAEILDAGFTHSMPGGSGRGFESGGALDRMLPGRDLAALTGVARAVGLDQLSDDELIGFVCAARRNASWQQALELQAVAELDRRRAGPGGGPGEHVAEEVAAALRLSGRAAEGLLGLAEGIGRLSQVPASAPTGWKSPGTGPRRGCVTRSRPAARAARSRAAAAPPSPATMITRWPGTRGAAPASATWRPCAGCITGPSKPPGGS